MKYVLHYDVAAMVLTVIILIHFYHKKSIKTPQTYVFIALIWMSLVTDAMDIATVVIDEYRVRPFIVNLVNVIYLIAFNVLPFMYYLYLFISTNRDRSQWSVKERLVLYAPVAWSILLIVTSPLTKLVFYYNLEEGYCHGPGFPLLYIATVTYMIASMSIALSRRKILTSWQRTSVYFYLSASFAGIILQTIFPTVLTLQFAVSLSLLLLYMSLESPDDDEDKFLGIYNRRGFDKMISNAVGKHDAFYVLVVSITNFHSIRETLGIDFGRDIQSQVVKSLKNALKPLELFFLSDGKFSVIADGKEEMSNHVVEILRKELGRPIECDGMNIQLESVLMQLDYPTEVRTVEDIMDAIDYSATVPFESNDGEVMHAGGEILDNRRRENRILQIMQQALANGTFQVYYQPIYSTQSGRFNSAEALIRLHDADMGYISPEEFIPMAEQNGMILKIGEFVFRTVCEMMARERIWEKGIDYIEVNLSVVQCMQEDICEMLYGIMDEYEIPYNCINLEVTETTLARDILWNTMERMTVGGVTFSLDDYGTGYSNLTNVLKYPFHIVKLDKSMVWYAMENEPAMRALTHTVAMIRDLDMHIVAEGVETGEQRDILDKMGCEYLQGYFFSKPVSEKDFLSGLS